MKTSARFPRFFALFYALAFVVLYIPRIVGLPWSGAFTGLQYVWHDLLFQIQPAALKAGDPRLALLAVDEEAGRRYGFPLPRAVYAQALDKLKSLRVRTVVFDILFFEPRPGDEELAAATQRFGRVVHLFSQEVQDLGVGVNVKNSLPVKPLLKAGRYFGQPNVESLLDNDGHLRGFRLIHPDSPDPINPRMEAVSLAAAALAADRDASVAQIVGRYGTDEKALNFRRPRAWPAHERPGADGNALNDQVIVSPYRRISLVDLLSGELSDGQKAALNGALVIVGSTALGYYDHYPSPFLDSAPGAEFHLNAIDNLIHEDALRYSSRAGTVLILLLAIALTLFLQRLSPLASAAAAAGSLLGWLGYCLWMFRRGEVVEFVAPALAFVSSYLVLSVHRVLTEGEEKRRIKGLFGQFVAPEIVDELARDPAKVKLGGEKRDMTIFFLDIAHFTTISEKMDPEQLIRFLNVYFSRLSRVILERRGTIDKYIGDCIMAFWNAPIENKEHRVDAVLAALQCQEAIKELNKTSLPNLAEAPSVRIGINSGVATVGLTGSEQKLQYTVIGDEVNLASRLEGANKFFGSRIIISESTYEGAKHRVAARTLGRVRVVGKEAAIKIYEPLAEIGRLSPEWEKGLPLYEKGIGAFESRKYGEALASFRKFAEIFPEDGPGQLYLATCREYAVIPPDASWTGVFNLTAK